MPDIDDTARGVLEDFLARTSLSPGQLHHMLVMRGRETQLGRDDLVLAADEIAQAEPKFAPIRTHSSALRTRLEL